MKFSRKTTAITAFVLGAVVLATSAFADVMMGSGYYNLKTAGKTTLEQLSKQTDNFSAEMVVSAKVDDAVFISSQVMNKFDLINQASEHHEKTEDEGKIREYYSYSDPVKKINKNMEDGSYHVWEKNSNANSNPVFENPFDDDQVVEVERILDALVGGLKDSVQIEEADGKKIYTGHLSDSQIPPLVNAVSSFAMKYSILDENTAKRAGVPFPKSDVYVMDVSGKAIENENGILESIVGSFSISAKDKDGISHLYSVELAVSVFDIGTTVVAAPDLTGEKVKYSKDSSGYPSLDEKYIGTYKNEIVEVEENQFVIKGQRVVEITEANEDRIAGRYYELNAGSDQPVRAFDFSGNLSERKSHYIMVEYMEDGEQKYGVINKSGRTGYNLYLELNVEFTQEEDGKVSGYQSTGYEDGFDSEFQRVFNAN